MSKMLHRVTTTMRLMHRKWFRQRGYRNEQVLAGEWRAPVGELPVHFSFC